MSHIETLGQLADARAEIARLTAELSAEQDRRSDAIRERNEAIEEACAATAVNRIRKAEVPRLEAEVARLTAELGAARAVPGVVEAAIGALLHGEGYSTDDHEIVALRTSIARAIREAADARGTVGGLLATAPRPQCPTHGDTVNCYCATGALHCHDCGHTPHFCTACDGYHDAGACPLPKGG